MSLLLLAVPAAAGEAASLVEDLPTVQAYLDEPVSEDELIKS